MARVLAVANQKGGVGKSTVCVNLSACLAERRQRVLIIDIDPSRAATSWLGITDPGTALYDALTGDATLHDAIRQTAVPGLDIIPACPDLAGIDRVLASQIGPDVRLRAKLTAIPQGRYDYIMVDCPPSLGLLTINSLTAADSVLVPVSAQVLSLAGLVMLQEAVELTQKLHNAHLHIFGIVVNQVDRRARHPQEIADMLRERFGRLVFRTVIHTTIRLTECAGFGKPITVYDPHGRGSEDFRTLAAEFLRRQKGGEV